VRTHRQKPGLCCVGWVAFLWNVSQGREAGSSHQSLWQSLTLLGVQTVIAPLDWLFWSRLVELSGWTLIGVVGTLDVIPLLGQAIYVLWLTAMLHRMEKRGCCKEDGALMDASCRKSKEECCPA